MPLKASALLLAIPPLIALLVETGPMFDILKASFVIVLYTLVVGVVVHLGADRASAWLKAHGLIRPLSRLVVVQAIMLSVVALLTLLMLPGMSMLCPSIAGSNTTLVIRGLVVSAAYITIVFALGQLGQRFRAVERDAAQKQERTRIAELRAEQSRTNPHFFRNTLGMIAELIHEDPDQAEATLLQLGDLFSYALDGYERSFVSLRDEVAALEAYVAIQSRRHGGRVNARVAIPEALLSTLVPPLLLQPLVENAIQHGFGRGEVSIVVEATEGDGTIELLVEDDGHRSTGRHRGTGTGLANVRARLRLAYGDRATLSAGPRPQDSGFACTLRIPCAS